MQIIGFSISIVGIILLILIAYKSHKDKYFFRKEVIGSYISGLFLLVSVSGGYSSYEYYEKRKDREIKELELKKHEKEQLDKFESNLSDFLTEISALQPIKNYYSQAAICYVYAVRSGNLIYDLNRLPLLNNEELLNEREKLLSKVRVDAFDQYEQELAKSVFNYSVKQGIDMANHGFLPIPLYISDSSGMKFNYLPQNLIVENCLYKTSFETIEDRDIIEPFYDVAKLIVKYKSFLSGEKPINAAVYLKSKLLLTNGFDNIIDKIEKEDKQM